MSHSLAHQERRRQRAKLKAKQNRVQRNVAGQWEPERERDEFGHFVEKMTNRQRCLWARTHSERGLLGKRDRNVETLAAFVATSW